MTTIDPDTCCYLLRAVTDQIAATFTRPAPDATLQDILVEMDRINTWAETEMRTALARHYPDIGYSGFDEADASTQTRPSDDAPYWVYDPIDGAYHTMQGLPLWSASLALVQNKKAVFGAVYDPTQRELFVASAGRGATLNGQRLRPGGKASLQTAIAATFLVPPFAHGDPAKHERTLALISAMSKKVFVVRMMTSASLHLAYVAAGRLDVLFDVSSTVHDWLAGGLLVTEAGLDMLGLDGEPFDWDTAGIIAAPNTLSGAVVEIVAQTTA